MLISNYVEYIILTFIEYLNKEAPSVDFNPKRF